MKKIKMFTLFLIVLSLEYSLPQNLNVQNLIGKQHKDVVLKYGNPVHQDSSIPSMNCLFYKSPTMVFVADETSVYQAEITKEYLTEDVRKNELDELIAGSLKDGFKSDTLSNNKIVLTKPGIKTEIDIINLNEKNLFEIKVKAVRHD